MLRSYIRGLSLKQKLPILICGLLLGVVALSSAASYGAVKNASLAIGRERLRTVTDQLAGVFATSVTGTEKALRAAAGDSAFAKFLREPSDANRSAALAAMAKPRRDSSLLITVELWDASGEFMLLNKSGTSAVHRDVSPELSKASVGARYLAIGRFRFEHDTIVLPIVAAIAGTDRPAGYYVEWHKVVTTAKQLEPILALIGPKAALLLGNDSGEVWTDLNKAVRAPAVEVRRSQEIAEYKRADGTLVLAAAHLIAGAPWSVIVEFPRDVVIAAASQFIRRAAIIGVILVALGFFAAWGLSRSITDPLDRLTAASTAMAGGDFTQKVDASRADELGRLAAAFNTMAAQVRDTTALLEHRVEERTRRLEDLQVVMLRTERLNTLATLGAGLAHDLNNLLFSISLASEQMQRDADGEHIDRPELLRRITKATTEAGRLTKRLMAFARSDDAAVQPAMIDVCAAVADQQDLLRMLLPRTVGLHVEVEAVSRRILLPATLVEQTLVNLVSNARDAMPDGGNVTVRVREEVTPTSQRLLIEVIDTGHGIAPELQSEIFAPFFSTKEEKGTGIGQASVRTLMESVGGTVSVSSSPGKGATFSLSFPLVSEERLLRLG